ncbi:hypothetical protein EI171_40555 [Bradyrhizobium sp. LCT2]|uniref:hypothetical protein n=1 Tax=Bradyrhizobium sp. LCT2 TaxID=2493093 RepID=UPI00137393E7|nr:hypothetical protein [Bradyrhizobium sp. LCT2]QHP73042.1 hypothetical protein EI171_40555 [Bradyrhizobium sp. LCT2]
MLEDAALSRTLFTNWQLASVPGFLIADDIERAIAACDGEIRFHTHRRCLGSYGGIWVMTV